MFSVKSLIKSLFSKKADYSEAWKGMANSIGSAPQIQSWSDSSSFDSEEANIGNFSVSAFNELSTQNVKSIAGGRKKIEDIRIEKKPVEVVNEILTDEPKFSVNDLDQQKMIVEWRMKVFERYHGNIEDERVALGYLKAREKWEKNKGLFVWPIATKETIDNLVKKYKLSNVPFSSWSKTIPMQATLEIEKFSAAWDKVSDRQPELRLIIGYVPEPKRPKPDPILLASSPFGRWWYVLGAWDEEVAIVDEIVYHRK